ncbi:MAG: hypothetical protein PW790_07050 [Parvibaculaceae bacterium]|nr:hypothetical protein [Parvibaculaceae bacterium]
MRMGVGVVFEPTTAAHRHFRCAVADQGGGRGGGVHLDAGRRQQMADNSPASQIKVDLFDPGLHGNREGCPGPGAQMAVDRKPVALLKAFDGGNCRLVIAGYVARRGPGPCIIAFGDQACLDDRQLRRGIARLQRGARRDNGPAAMTGDVAIMCETRFQADIFRVGGGEARKPGLQPVAFQRLLERQGQVDGGTRQVDVAFDPGQVNLAFRHYRAIVEGYGRQGEIRLGPAGGQGAQQADMKERRIQPFIRGFFDGGKEQLAVPGRPDAALRSLGIEGARGGALLHAEAGRGKADAGHIETRAIGGLRLHTQAAKKAAQQGQGEKPWPGS